MPKETQANLRFREDLIRAGGKDEALARDLRRACREDLLFYVNTFGWTYDPRKDPAAIPFITWPFQDEAFAELFASVKGGEDVLIEKSRDMGASWLCLTLVQWLWQFKEYQSFLLVSRKEDLVDKNEDPDCLFWKLDFLLKNQPKWLAPAVGRQKLHLHNRDNGSTIDGDSTTGDVGRGGRRTAVLLDEFASVENGHQVLAATADNTRCRVFNSTPKGTGNAFYDVAKSGTKKLRLHWTAHPEKADGLYWLQGKPRSPWYDRECRRRHHPMEIAQELDIDYLGSDYQFFDPGEIDAVIRRDCRPPYARGRLVIDEAAGRPVGFEDDPGGRLLLWLHPDRDGRPPQDRTYVIGVDVATGTGASNSVFSVADRETGEKVAEYADPRVRPEAFAALVAAAARWFGGAGRQAYLIWEATGPGRNFGDRLLELGAVNYYRREKDGGLVKEKTDVPGWWQTPEKKMALLGEYRRALGVDFTNRSETAVRECLEYVFLPSQEVAHSRSKNTVDPSGARKNHADRVMADALCWRGMKEVTRKTPDRAARVPAGSLAWRRELDRAERTARAAW